MDGRLRFRQKSPLPFDNSTNSPSRSVLTLRLSDALEHVLTNEGSPRTDARIPAQRHLRSGLFQSARDVRAYGSSVESGLQAEAHASAAARWRPQEGQLNQPGGYWMLGVNPRAAAAMNVRSRALDWSPRVLLASDGLWHLGGHSGDNRGVR